VRLRIRPPFAAALLAAGACTSAKLATSAAEPPPRPDSAPSSGSVSEPARAVYDGPATTLGRTALLRAEAAVRGKLTSVMSVGPGAEVGRLMPEEWLRGEPREEGEPLTVLSAETGHLPAVAHEGVFLLHLLPASGNWELVEVVPLDDDDGPDRLAALRKFLEIESIPGPSWRMSELRKYLRVAVLSDRSWTRWNAAREYAALVRDVPGALAVEDRAPLTKARDVATERQLRALLDAVLARCPGTPAPKSKQAATAASDATDGALADSAARFAAPDATPAVRRQAVIDAAVALGARAAPLFERALADADPSVREAGAAAAGQFRVASLEPKIAAMLAADGSPVVRRSLVVAAGRLKSSASISSLAALATEDGPFARDAAFALARIRDDAAVGELRRLRAGAKAKDWIELLDFLLSDAFVRQERALDDTK
jgi:hypothetical protein